MGQERELGERLFWERREHHVVHLVCPEEPPGGFQVPPRVQAAPDDLWGVNQILDPTANGCVRGVRLD